MLKMTMLFRSVDKNVVKHLATPSVLGGGSGNNRARTAHDEEVVAGVGGDLVAIRGGNGWW